MLDLGSGRGGDLGKYRHLGISTVRGVDLSQASVEEARRRTPLELDAQFLVADFVADATTVARVLGGAGPFDLVTAFFTLQYAERMEPVLEMARSLAHDQTRLVVAVPDARRIVELTNHDGADQLARACIDGEKGGRTSYTFDLAGAIDACPEYLVELGELEEAMRRTGWFVETKMPFHEARALSPPLMKKMGAGATLRAAESEVVGLYFLMIAAPCGTPAAAHQSAPPEQ